MAYDDYPERIASCDSHRCAEPWFWEFFHTGSTKTDTPMQRSNGLQEFYDVSVAVLPGRLQWCLAWTKGFKLLQSMVSFPWRPRKLHLRRQHLCKWLSKNGPMFDMDGRPDVHRKGWTLSSMYMPVLGWSTGKIDTPKVHAPKTNNGFLERCQAQRKWFHFF